MKSGRGLPDARRVGSRSTSAAARCARDFDVAFAFVAAFGGAAFAVFLVVFFAVLALLIALTLSFTERFECHTASSAFAICSMVRFDTTDFGFSSKMSGSLAVRAAASSDLINSQLSRFSPWRRGMRTRCQRPCSFSPSSVKSRWPFASPLCGSNSGVQWPRSQISTVPPPYWPFGIVPSNALYSIGWSSTSTASRFSPGTRLGPRVTAQLFMTPSSSRRRS